MVIMLELVGRREDIVLWHPDELDSAEVKGPSGKQQEESKAKVKGTLAHVRRQPAEQ